MNTVVTSREEILRAAGEMVKVVKGDGVSMRGIARECGIAVGSIYNYFPTKNDLMIAVVVEMWKEIFFVPQNLGALIFMEDSLCLFPDKQVLLAHR